jgi:hypothetical protein
LQPGHFITHYNTANLHYDFGRHFTCFQEILRKGALLRQFLVLCYVRRSHCGLATDCIENDQVPKSKKWEEIPQTLSTCKMHNFDMRSKFQESRLKTEREVFEGFLPIS